MQSQFNISLGLSFLYFQLQSILLIEMNIEQIINLFQYQLDSIKSKINMLVKQLSYSLITKAYKRVSSILKYFSNFLTLSHQHNNEAIAILVSYIIHQITALVNATQYTKYGHRLPLLKFVEKKLASVNDSVCKSLQKQMSYEGPAKNEQYSYFNLSQMSVTEQRFLKSEKFHIFLNSLMINQVKLYNPQCICCSQVFIEKSPIFNGNPYFKVVVDLSLKKAFDPIKLEQYLNAIYNAGGGVIIVGAKKMQNTLIASGVLFKSQQQVEQNVTIIKKVLYKLNLTCEKAIVEVIKVHSNYTQEPIISKIAEQKYRFCLRIIVIPNIRQKMCCIELENKVKDKYFEMYKFDEFMQPTKITCKDQDNKFESIYTEMLAKYRRQEKQLINSHQNIKCFRPHTVNSKIFNQMYESGKFVLADFMNAEIDIKQQMQKQVEVFHDNPKFKFQNTSLLVVGSKKNERYIRMFVEYLKQKKQQFELVKPYEKTFLEGTGIRNVWMLSHEMSISDLKKKLKLQEQKDKQKETFVKIIPVSKNLQIDKSKLSAYNLEKLKKRFYERFNDYFQIEEGQIQNQNGEIMPICFFKFYGYSQSIFAYLFLEEVGYIWSYFIKDGVVYIKKAK